MDETEREYFEAEAEEHGFPLGRDHDGSYANGQTDAGWLFWRARAALDVPKGETSNP